MSPAEVGNSGEQDRVPPRTWTQTDLDRIVDSGRAGAAGIFSKENHRSMGYMLATGFVSARKMVERTVMGIDRTNNAADRRSFEELIQNVINKTGLTNLTARHISPTIGSSTGFVVGAAPVYMSRMVEFFTGDFCRMKPLWDKNPKRALIEYLRLRNLDPLMGQFFKHHNNPHFTGDVVDQYDFSAANLDPVTFPDPYEFNPDRANLSRVISSIFVDFFEGDVPDNPQFFRRGRPSPSHSEIPKIFMDFS